MEIDWDKVDKAHGKLFPSGIYMSPRLMAAFKEYHNQLEDFILHRIPPHFHSIVDGETLLGKTSISKPVEPETCDCEDRKCLEAQQLLWRTAHGYWVRANSNYVVYDTRHCESCGKPLPRRGEE